MSLVLPRLREKGVQSLTIEEQEAAKKMLWASIQVYETDDTEAKNYLRNVDTKYPVLFVPINFA